MLTGGIGWTEQQNEVFSNPLLHASIRWINDPRHLTDTISIVQVNLSIPVRWCDPLISKAGAGLEGVTAHMISRSGIIGE
jgi:hypothetical protein